MMMLSFKLRVMVFVCWLLLLSVTAAAAADCPALVQNALKTIDDACSDTGRNQACYGNISLLAEPQAGMDRLAFRQKGDRVNLLDVKSLKLSAMDAASNIWGVALLKVQANLPDTLPGQNVTFLLFGDVSLDNNQTPTTTPAAPNDITYGPMQAFTFRTGLNDAPCAEAPSSGILIQSPATPPVQLRINAVDITLGSTIYVQLSAASEMLVSVMEGQATLTAFGTTVVAPAGTQVRVTLDGVYAAAAAPSDPEPYVVADLSSLPIAYLPDAITLAPPLDAASLAALVPPTPTAVPTAASGAGLPTTSDLPLSGAWRAHKTGYGCPAYDDGVIYRPEQIEYEYDLRIAQTRFEQDGAVLVIDWVGGSLTYTRVDEGVYTTVESPNEFSSITYTLWVLAADHMQVEAVAHDVDSSSDFDGCINDIEYTFTG